MCTLIITYTLMHTQALHATQQQATAAAQRAQQEVADLQQQQAAAGKALHAAQEKHAVFVQEWEQQREEQAAEREAHEALLQGQRMALEEEQVWGCLFVCVFYG